jgi:transposase
MLNNATDFRKVYIACGYTNLRLGIDGLSCLVKEQFNLDPFVSGNLFLFCGRRSDRIKGLVWEEDGFLLLYKRLEAGRFQWPRASNEVADITPEQYTWLMQGLAIEQKKVIHKVTPSSPL